MNNQVSPPMTTAAATMTPMAIPVLAPVGKEEFAEVCSTVTLPGAVAVADETEDVDVGAHIRLSETVMHAYPASQHPPPLIPAPAVHSVWPWAEHPLGMGTAIGETEEVEDADTVEDVPIHFPEEAQSNP